MTILDLLREEEKYILKMRRLYELYGYKKYKMSKFEHYDLYLENKSFLSSSNILTFTDAGGTLLALKPDITLSIVKNAPESFFEPEKVYYCENVYRSTDQSSGIREILQVGIEYIGEMDTYAQAEVLALAAKSLREISSSSVIGISHMGLVTALLDQAKLEGMARREVLRCLGEKNVHELQAVCREEAVAEKDINKLTSVAEVYGPLQASLAKLADLLADTSAGDPARLAVDELAQLYQVLDAVGCGTQFVLDFSVTNDMDYYNGVTFQGFVDGIPAHVLSGGRYDTLVKKFGKQAGAIGFAIYPNLLEQFSEDTRDSDLDVLITYGSADPAAAAAEAQKLTNEGLQVRVQKDTVSTVRYKKHVRMDKKEGGAAI
ncbi:MAG: hypothetical protein HFE66_06715 [Clostridiales bacterium]|jgi:ATP phosphoribosyltransferase regulatory subunit|nr:hypothetical protein [Clostridiales bacterium]